MINQLPDLEKEDLRYNLHAVPVEPENYNIVLVYPQWQPAWKKIPEVPLQSPTKIKNNLAKLGIVLT
jgi:hypothetical protein